MMTRIDDEAAELAANRARQLVAVLKDAIKHRRQISFRARGHYREACPHVLHTRDERIWAVLVWQCGGTCDEGVPAGGDWRLFDLAEITELSVVDGGWWYPVGRKGGYERASGASNA